MPGPASDGVVQAAKARQNYRQQEGALNFQLPEAKIQVQQAFTPDSSVHVKPYQQNDGSPSQLLVSEMMVLAGQAIAQLGE